jgi:hypothetical protein
MNYVLTGNIVNNQPWAGVDNHLLFAGMDHSISCAPGARINAQLQADDSLHNFSLLSDVILNTTNSSNLGFSQLNAGNHKFKVEGGHFANCRIHSSDTLQFDANISSLDLTGNYKLTGNIICYTNLAFYDQATNFGNIQFASGIGGDPLKLKGDFVNKGIMSHSWVQVEKNIFNDGSWESYETEFAGTGEKHISQTTGHPFGGTQFMSDNSGSVIFLDSDIELTVPTFHLNNNTLDCGNHTLTANTTFYDGTINSESEIEGNSDFWTASFTGSLILSGNNRFSNCTVDGTLENTGMMKDITFYGGTFSSYQHLLNHNSIQSMNLKIYGNLTNYGTIDNNSIVDITGNVTQYINMTQSIESQVNFYSDLTGAAYQWMKDGQDILNANNVFLRFSSLQLSDAGVYRCRVTDGSGTISYSRDIIVLETTSMAENYSGDINLSAWPNPFTDHFILNWEQKNCAQIGINLFDASGKLIKEIVNSEFPAGCNQINITEVSLLNPGIYFLRMIVDEKPKNIKLIHGM